MKKKSMDWYKQQQRFSVRKYHFGAASVLLGTALVFGGAQASADEVTAPATPSTESTTATSAETTTASEGAPVVLTASEATPASLTASEASSSTEATSLDKGALQVALSQAKALDLSNKTSETVAILLAQIEHAQTVLNTATSQEELNQAVTDLQAAQAQLADKPAQPVAVSPASVATTPAPATSTTSSTPEATTPAPATSTASSTPEATTPASVTASSTSSTSEATTPASVTASSTSSTPEATTPASTSTSTESSSSPTVSTRSRRTRRDTSSTLSGTNTSESIIKVDKDNFSDYFNLHGNASYDSNSGVVTLTPARVYMNGSTALNVKIDTTKDFKLEGEFLIKTDDPNRIPVDGIGFALTPDDQTKLGYNGAAVGISGLKDAVGFKIDTFLNRDINNNGGNSFPYIENGVVVVQNAFEQDPSVVLYGTDVQSHGIGHDYHHDDFGAFMETDEHGFGRHVVDTNKASLPSFFTLKNDFQSYVISYKADTKILSVSLDNKTYTYNMTDYLNKIQNKYGSTDLSLRFTASSNAAIGQDPNTVDTLQQIKIKSFEFAASGFNRINYINQNSGNRIVNPTDFLGLKNEVKDVRTPANATNVTITSNGYTLVATDTSKAPTYNATNGTVTLTSDNQFITYTYKDTQAPTITHTPDVTTGARNPMTPVVVNFADNSDNELDEAGNKVVTTTSSVSGLPTGVTYNPTTRTISGTPTTPGTYTPTVTVTDAAGNSTTDTFNFVVTPQSDEFTPVGQGVTVKHNEVPIAENGIANTSTLPTGTGYTWKTPVDTSTPGNKPGTVVVTYPDGTKDEVPVTVTVTPQADEFSPVGQDVPTKHGETPSASDGISNKGDLPAGTTYDWKTPVDTTTSGDKPGTVVVTYPDGTKDEVPVTVKVKPQSDDYTPVGKDVPAKHGDTPSAASGIANKGDLPTGTTYDWKNPVDTTTPGDKPGTVVVTYPDGTKDEVPVTVKVQPQADDYDPQAQPVSVDHGATPNAEDGIANKGTLPPGTTYDWKTPIDTSTPGTKPGTVVVTYPDGTKDEVPVPVTVGEEAALYTPVGQDVPAKHGETPAASQGIANRGTLPAGTTYDWKTPVDTTTPGDKPATVVVTYPDGSKDEVPVTVKVKPQSDEFTPNGQDVPTKHGETPNAADGIANKGDLPAGTTYDWKTPVDTSTPGDKPGTVVVTYPDGTKDEVPVTVKVKPQSDEFTPTGQDVPAKHGETPNAADGITNKGDLPAGTTYDWKTPVDTSTPGDKPGTVVVTYPDGTKDEVPVTVKVKPQSDEFTPTGQDVPAKHGETPNAADGIANKGDLPAGTTYDWKTPVDTTTPGDKPGTVVVTYPDGTKDEVPVTVKVKPQSDEFTPVGKDVPAKHGETPKAEDGIANKGDLPDGTKYDWKTPVDTTTPGDKPGTVMVTYPDGTKDEVPVTVKVKPQSDEFTPQPKDVSTDHGKTPKAEDGIANKGDLPDGTKYDWKTPVDTTTPGDKPGTVVVTYPDGTKDEVPVTVHVGSQSDLYNPDGQNLNVKQGDQPEASKGIANRGNLPDGTTYDWKTPVDTSTVGDKPATVVVTYPDGSKDEVPVTVKVTEKLHVKTPADKVPVKDPSHLTPDDINKVVENIKKENPGLPDDAKITVNPNGGDTTIETKDGDKVTIPGSDLVRPETDADKNNVKVPADKVPVKDPSNLTDAEKDKVKDNIKKANPDLPNGTKIDVDKDGTATITFPDGSTKVIPGTDLVRPEADADKNNVKVPADKVPVKDPSNLTDAEKDKVKDNIKKANPDLPNGTKIDVAKDGTATITFPDGSTKVIPGSDLVRPETDADKNNVKVPADKVPVKDPSNLTDAEKDKVKDNIKKANPDLPNGTKIEVAKDGTATITFPDGSTKVIPGSDLVRPETDADRYTPKGQDVPVKQGETPKAEDGIANKGDLPNGTKIEWKETPDTSKVGDHNATIVITYPDGSKDEVTVTVKVSPNANNNGHNGNNGSHGNGNSGSHNNGTNGDQGQGNKDKKDQAGKDTNNGLDKLFSNSGNGSASGDQSGASRKQAPALPNTGDASNPAMALAFAALLGGTALAMKKRKKEEEE